MTHAIITVGLGFGDEGKGATVDFLTRRYRAAVVVRYCGGPQAGHNVQLPDGRRHTFSQFGAGTLAGARTYLGPRMILNPATLVPEADHLRSLGVDDPQSMLSVHPDCLVSTTYHVMMNRLREVARGADKHGSCGLGVGETRQYWLQYGLDAPVAADLHDPQTLLHKLTLLQDRLLLEVQTLPRLDPIWLATLQNTSPQQEAELLMDCMQGVGYDWQMPTADTIIFEGSQGVLLDEYHGFHPFTTWSTVTARHAFELIEASGIDRVTTLGLTRAYTTRHGAGPFPTACPAMTARQTDPGNPRNDWQDGMRFGPLDLVLLRYAARTTQPDGLVVNHLDELPAESLLCRRYQDQAELQPGASGVCLREQQQLTEHLDSVRPELETVTRQQLLDELATIAPLVITSEGPTHQDRCFLGAGDQEGETRGSPGFNGPKSGDFGYGDGAERL
ncbi:adenylosuccinate synthetase [Roseimaritima ulvae]|uniref:Adenylosuccinate synthetase n=1 Tax=Roseimaritima ulvae TaxID=980254 RepID=A0A5B9QNW3_9BACT|nr:adenylosuccinate synthetase [Roseimaritima ulvae]QEG39639.1 Adenylosuccinate synthetase [Roseimaritima ulvae]